MNRVPLRFQRARRPLLPLAVLALLALAVACGNQYDSAPPAATALRTETPAATAVAQFPTTIVDSGGAAVVLDAAPQRIISYSPGGTEILFALGAGDRVIATDEFSDYPAAALAVEKLTYSSPDPEAALALDPDLVLMSTRQREQVEQFRSLGLTVLFVEDAGSLEGVLDNVRLFGQITGNTAEADALIEQMTARVEAVTAGLSDIDEGPRVFFELTSDLFTVGPDTFVGDLLTLARARNIAEGAESPFPQLSAEAIVEADPEVVLLADGEFGEDLQTVCSRPGWDAVSACVNARVEAVDGDVTSRPGPRVVDGLELVARLLYPERFP